jgi:hypothetical protein
MRRDYMSKLKLRDYPILFFGGMGVGAVFDYLQLPLPIGLTFCALFGALYYWLVVAQRP